MRGTGEGGNMQITSSAFSEGEMIPVIYTADGQNISPPLEFSDVPEGTLSLVLICEDPDAPMTTWDHWLAWNIPPDMKTIASGTTPPGQAGRNGWGKFGYGGPAPPSGTHRYFFKLIALDTLLDLPNGSYKGDLEKAMKGHVVARAQLMGKYSR